MHVLITYYAASGSLKILYSALGVIFPNPDVPPIKTISLIYFIISGCYSNNFAVFVCGPVITKVNFFN